MSAFASASGHADIIKAGSSIPSPGRPAGQTRLNPAHWYVARYVLPGNVQKVILKPKQFGFNAPAAADAGY